MLPPRRARSGQGSLPARPQTPAYDTYKTVITSGLVSMSHEQREQFVEAFRDRLGKTGTSLGNLAFKVGVSSREITLITPTEIGQMARYLMINYNWGQRFLDDLLEPYSEMFYPDRKPSTPPDEQSDPKVDLIARMRAYFTVK